MSETAGPVPVEPAPGADTATETGAGSDVPGAPAKLITCILPDDGSERRLLEWLRDEAGMPRAHSVYCRAHSVLRDAVTPKGRLPEPELVRLVSLVVDTAHADALFERIYAQAAMHRPGGGALLMTPLPFATPFALPADVPFEDPGTDG